MKRTVDGTVECLIMKSLNLFERDPAAKAAFLSRIPTRSVPVSARVADLFYEEKQRANAKAAVPALQVADDIINRMLDREESRIAVRRALGRDT